MEQHKNEVNDPRLLIIYLRVFNGINFHQDKHGRKIALIGSLNQQALDPISSRPVTPGSGNATFCTTIVWSCNRSELKELKSINAPIKLECFEEHPNGKTYPIGSVVIPLRSIPVVTLARTRTVKSRWFRLIGIETEIWRRKKPELQLLAMVTNSQYLNKIEEDELADRLAQCATTLADPSPYQLPDNVELLADRGLLQIGCPETNSDIFLYEIVLKYGQHLEIVEEVDTFRLRYQVLGTHHYSVAERLMDGSSVFTINEKICLRVRSSAKTLADCFSKILVIAVELLPDTDERDSMPPPNAGAIRRTFLDLFELLQASQIDDFKERFADKDYKLETIESIPFRFPDRSPLSCKSFKRLKEEDENVLPSLKCKFSLRYMGSDRSSQEQTSEGKAQSQEQKQNGSPEPASSTEEHLNAREVEMNESLPTNIPIPPTPEPTDANDEDPQAKVDINAILSTSERDLRDIRRIFAFRVRVGTVKFHSRPPAGLWQLALQHPKADTPFVKVALEVLPDAAAHEDRIEFGNLTLELLFSALPDQVFDMIGSEPSTLTIVGPHDTNAAARLDNESLLIGTRERQPVGVVMMVNAAGENVSIATIDCELKEVGLNYNSQQVGPEPTDCCHHTALPAQKRVGPFHAQTAYQMVQEQKEWMQQERAKFVEDLKQKGRKHLTDLAHSWKVRRAEAEKLLGEKLEHADALVTTLADTRRILEEGTVKDSSREKLLEQQFRAQLEEIRAKALRLEREAEVQIDTTRRQCQELQQQLTELNDDQQNLLEMNRELRGELNAEHTKREEEVARYRQQLDEAIESKQYYKEQWAKLTRKVCQLEQELSMTRTPYFQPSKTDLRRRRGKNAGGSESRLALSSSGQQQGGGDCCRSCDCPMNAEFSE